MNEAEQGKVLPFDVKKHITWLIEHQDGGWGEYVKEKKQGLSSPQVTAQGVIGLLPFLNDENYADLHNSIRLSITQALDFLSNSLDLSVNGWADHSGSYAILDATASVLFACLVCAESGISLPEKISSNLDRIILFLINEQNEDGGWGIRKGDDSRMQVVYWVLKTFNKARSTPFQLNFDSAFESSFENGLRWLKTNYAQQEENGFSITLAGEINPIISAYGVEIATELNIQLNKKKIFDYLKQSRVSMGSWPVRADLITYGNIPRRVYNLADSAKIIECLLLLDVEIMSKLFQDSLRQLKNLELEGGGFKHQDIDKEPVGWFTGQVLKLFAAISSKLRNLQEPTDQEIGIGTYIKKHVFNEAALMIGRFQPPHLGHYNALRALLLCDSAEFHLPEEALNAIKDIESVIIGVARKPIDKKNPFCTGEIQDIWRHIIDEDEELKKYGHIINIQSCVAISSSSTIMEAIYEFTSNKKSVLVVTGNNMIIEQCKRDEVKHVHFRRGEISGSRIRELISKIDFDNVEAYQEEMQALRKMLHYSAFNYLMDNGLFAKAHGILNAR